MKRFALLFALLLFSGTPARADDAGILERCARWSGGTSTETQPNSWHKNGHGVEFALFFGGRTKFGWEGMPYFRYENEERHDNPFDDTFGWSAWTPVQGLFDGPTNSIVFTAKAVWLLEVEQDRLVGRHLMLPVAVNKETREPESLVPDGESTIVLYCQHKG